MVTSGDDEVCIRVIMTTLQLATPAGLNLFVIMNRIINLTLLHVFEVLLSCCSCLQSDIVIKYKDTFEVFMMVELYAEFA